MFSKNTNNKLGINDSKIGKNDNYDSGSNKNNVSKQRATNRNSQLETHSNSHNNYNYDTNQNYNFDRIENNHYYTTKAKEDSKNEQYLRVIELKNSALKRIYEIRDSFIACEDCKQIHQTDITKMFARLQKQEQMQEEFATLYDQEWDYGIVPDLPFTVDTWLEERIKFTKQQKEFLVNFRAMKPGFYTPCKLHTNLGREWYMLDMQINDYDKLLNK